MSGINNSYNNIGEILLSQDAILARIDELADQINSDYQHRQCLTVVGVLKGAFLFMADLIRRLDMPLRCEFLQTSTYGGGTVSMRPPEILVSTGLEVMGQRVLLVEDVVDTGSTVDYVLRRIEEKGPRDIRVCAFLSKKERRQLEVKLDYIGFEIPDRFVVGYGLDHGERFRNLPYVAVLDEA